MIFSFFSGGSPPGRARSKKATFLIHPRDAGDFYRRLAGILNAALGWTGFHITEEDAIKRFSRPWLNRLVETGVYWLPKLFPRMGYTVCTPRGIRNNGNEVGHIVAILLTARQIKEMMLGKDGAGRTYLLKRIEQAAQFAQRKLGSSVVGLGEYTAPATQGGHLLVRDKRLKGVTITHGDSLTAAAGVAAIKRIAVVHDVQIETSTIAIVGIPGIVGTGIARILAVRAQPAKMVLVGHSNVAKVRKLERVLCADGFQGKLVSAVDMGAVKGADVIVLATSHPGNLLYPEHFARDRQSIVLDMAQPNNFTEEVYELCRGKGLPVVRYDGGFLATPPNFHIGFDMGTPRGVVFACFVQTMLQGIANITEHDVGRNGNPDLAVRLWRIAEEQGFRLAPLTNFSHGANPPRGDIGGRRIGSPISI